MGYEHERPLEALKTIGSFDENVDQIGTQAFTDGINLRDVGAAYADHLWCYRRWIAVVG